MELQASLGILSLLPVVLALTLAFITKNAVFSLLIGCIIGVIIAGFDPATGLADLFKTSLGTKDFIWVMMIEVAVGILIVFYLRAGVISAFTDWASTKIRTRRTASGFGWILSLFIFFSDYFSPLFAGPIAKPLTDKYKISREMLAYVLDSGSAPVCTLVPLSAWAVFIAGILVGYGPINSPEIGMEVFIATIPYNVYGWSAVILAGLIAYQIIPNYGPMKKAELRAQSEGKVLRDRATPLTGKEIELIEPIKGTKTNLFVYLLMPVLIIVCVALGSFIYINDTKVLEAFIVAIMYLAIVMSIGKRFTGLNDSMDVALTGIKAVLPAILILAMAYSINSISKTLGAQQYIISITEAWITPGLFPFIAFITSGLISFFTGTSWGTYAIVIPFSLPIAFNLTGGTLSPIVFISISAVIGGGLFGDHASPVSDTTVLSSFGACSDHIDHVSTQLPYALTAAFISCIFYLIAGLFF